MPSLTLQDLTTWAQATFPASFTALNARRPRYTSTDWLNAAPRSPTYDMVDLGTSADMDVSAYLTPGFTIDFLSYNFLTGDHVPITAADIFTNVQLKGMWEMLRGKQNAMEMMCSVAMYFLLLGGGIKEFVESKHVSLKALEEACKVISVQTTVPVQEKAKHLETKSALPKKAEKKQVAEGSKAAPAAASVWGMKRPAPPGKVEPPAKSNARRMPFTEASGDKQEVLVPLKTESVWEPVQYKVVPRGRWRRDP